MLWSGSSPLSVMRGSMWGFLLVAGAAWLVIGWSILRLEPTDVAPVIGPVIVFGAVCEGLRALAGTRTWWLNAGLAALFAATGALVLLDRDSTYATPASLIGWYLLVRGAVDVAVGMLTRGSDRIWTLVVTIGVLEAGLGFFAASPLARTGGMLVLVLGGVGVLRAVADLVTALRLREAVVARRDVLELPPERAAGVSGYAAGLSDFETAPPVRRRPRHRARPAESTLTTTTPAASTVTTAAPGGESFHEQVVRTTAQLDAMLAQAGITGPRSGAVERTPKDLPAVPDTPEGAETAPVALRGAEADPRPDRR